MEKIEIIRDREKMDVEMIHAFLTTSYWGRGRSLEEVKKALNHSLNFGIFENGQQIGFARVVTDHCIFAYLMDVFILPEHRGKGRSKLLLDYIFNAIQVKKWLLGTLDAHDLYRKFGFTEVKHVERLMEKGEQIQIFT